jgi:hypothetical protein
VDSVDNPDLTPESGSQPVDNSVDEMGTIPLFSTEPTPRELLTAISPTLSTGKSTDIRRRIRQEEMIAKGFHPLTRRKLIEGDLHCRDCANAFRHSRYWKCQHVPMTFGPGTDLRLKWPACELFKPKET